MKRTLSAVAAYAALALVVLMSFGATAFAAGATLPDDNTAWLDLLRPIYDAFAGGHRVAAGAFALVAAVALLKRYAAQLPKIGPAVASFLHTDVGGAASTLALSFFGAIAAATSGSAPWSWAIFSTAGGIAVAAIGGYTVIRRLVVDQIVASKWYATAPSWIKAVLSVITFIGSKPDPVAEAEKAGADAVATSPATGADGVAGPAQKF